jgi:hypothetical protein
MVQMGDGMEGRMAPAEDSGTNPQNVQQHSAARSILTRSLALAGAVFCVVALSYELFERLRKGVLSIAIVTVCLGFLALSAMIQYFRLLTFAPIAIGILCLGGVARVAESPLVESAAIAASIPLFVAVFTSERFLKAVERPRVAFMFGCVLVCSISSILWPRTMASNVWWLGPLLLVVGFALAGSSWLRVRKIRR